MAKLSFFLDKRRPDKKGNLPIRLLICNASSTTTVSTGVYIPDKYFKGEPSMALIKSAPNAKEVNATLYNTYLTYFNAILVFERSGRLRTMNAKDIKQYAEKGNETATVSFSRQMTIVAEQYRNSGTRGIYDYASRTLHEYMKTDEITFDEINYKTLCAFDRWMEDNGIRTNTRSIIMRCLRRVFNKAIDDEVIDQSLYPFRKFKIKQAAKEKEFLPLDKFLALKNADLEPVDAAVRDFFMLSFYFCGINAIDLFNMPKPTTPYLSYIRTKIAHSEPQPVHLIIQPEAQAIIDKYAGTKYMLNFAEHYTTYKTFQSFFNKHLRKIGKELQFPRCYYYLARYTWATYADKLDISERIIGKALGHTGTSLADKRYISFDWSKVDEANRKVIDYVLNPPKSVC